MIDWREEYSRIVDRVRTMEQKDYDRLKTIQERADAIGGPMRAAPWEARKVWGDFVHDSYSSLGHFAGISMTGEHLLKDNPEGETDASN